MLHTLVLHISITPNHKYTKSGVEERLHLCPLLLPPACYKFHTNASVPDRSDTAACTSLQAFADGNIVHKNTELAHAEFIQAVELRHQAVGDFLIDRRIAAHIEPSLHSRVSNPYEVDVALFGIPLSTHGCHPVSRRRVFSSSSVTVVGYSSSHRPK